MLESAVGATPQLTTPAYSGCLGKATAANRRLHRETVALRRELELAEAHCEELRSENDQLRRDKQMLVDKQQEQIAELWAVISRQTRQISGLFDALRLVRRETRRRRNR